MFLKHYQSSILLQFKKTKMKFATNKKVRISKIYDLHIINNKFNMNVSKFKNERILQINCQ